MSINLVLPFISTIIMGIFTAYVLQRYVARRRLSFLFWGIGLAMFAVGSIAEALLTTGWNRWGCHAGISGCQIKRYWTRSSVTVARQESNSLLHPNSIILLQ